MALNNLNQEFFVQSILDKRINLHGQVEYLIQWEGFPIEDSTWEPMDNVACIQDMIDQYEKKINREREKANKENDLIQMTRETLNDCIPSKILSVKLHKNSILCFCEFEEASNGITQDPCYIPSRVLRDICPKVLVDYYESKIWFVNKKTSDTF